MSPAAVLLLFGVAMIVGGWLMYVKNLPTDYERKTGGITAAMDPMLAAGLSSMRFWRRSWRIIGTCLAALGVFGVLLSFFELARS